MKLLELIKKKKLKKKLKIKKIQLKLKSLIRTNSIKSSHNTCDYTTGTAAGYGAEGARGGGGRAQAAGGQATDHQNGGQQSRRTGRHRRHRRGHLRLPAHRFRLGRRRRSAPFRLQRNPSILSSYTITEIHLKIHRNL